ncbi:MAG: GxxExxY protein [Planctomycetota bacterium]
MIGKYKFEDLSKKIINAAIEVHKTLGPGFLESLYEEALCLELNKQDIKFERQKDIKIYYEKQLIGNHRLDLLIENEIIVELKAVRNLENIHFVVVKSYLKAMELKIALLLNFAKPILEIKRIVN